MSEGKSKNWWTSQGVIGQVLIGLVVYLLTKLGEWIVGSPWNIPTWLTAIADWLGQHETVPNFILVAIALQVGYVVWIIAALVRALIEARRRIAVLEAGSAALSTASNVVDERDAERISVIESLRTVDPPHPLIASNVEKARLRIEASTASEHSSPPAAENSIQRTDFTEGSFNGFFWRWSYVDGQPVDLLSYCDKCDFDMPLDGLKRVKTLFGDLVAECHHCRETVTLPPTYHSLPAKVRARITHALNNGGWQAIAMRAAARHRQLLKPAN